MTFFTQNEFKTKYNIEVEEWQIEMASEMIFNQVGLRYRADWDDTTCPTPIKNASMEQLRFILDYDIPFIDYKDKVKAGEMESAFKSDYSTLALRMLGNAGYLNRTSPINSNMSMELPF